jgi:hypothetical protein
MKGQGGAALKGILLLINWRQDPRPLLHDLLLINLPLVKGLMDVAHAVCRRDIAFANAQTLLLFLGMIAVGGMESISLVVHRQRLKIENVLQPVLQQGVVNVVLGSDPILPHSVEVQNDWMGSELYPHASCSFNFTTAGKLGSGAFNGRRERCPPKGHKTRDCPSRGNVAKNQCCGGYGKHLTGCAQASAQNKERAPEDARARRD